MGGPEVMDKKEGGENCPPSFVFFIFFVFFYLYGIVDLAIRQFLPQKMKRTHFIIPGALYWILPFCL
jgi:hypothetical protein